MYSLTLMYVSFPWVDGASPGAGNLTQFTGGYVTLTGRDTNPIGIDEITDYQIRYGGTAGPNVLIPQASTTHASGTTFSVATTLIPAQIASLNTVGNPSGDWFFGITYSQANPNLYSAVATLVLYTGVAPGPRPRPCGMTPGVIPDLLGNLPEGGGSQGGARGPCQAQPGCQSPGECGLYTVADPRRSPLQPPGPCIMRIGMAPGR